MTASLASMLRIERITWREIRLELKEPFRISSGTMHERRIGLLELTTRDGVTAWSECVAFQRPNYSSETIDTAWMAIREWLAPRLLDRPLDGPEDVAAILSENIRGHNMAKAALEMGCWALAAEIQGLPLSAILGGTRTRVPTGISLGIQSAPDALVARALDAVAAGYRKIKVKIQPGRDVEYVRAVRRAIGPDIGLMADANSAYTLDDADHLGAARRVRSHHARAAARRRRSRSPRQLQRRMSTPICLDESITGVDRARGHDRAGQRAESSTSSQDASAGCSVARHSRHCRAAGIPVWCGGMLESGIGRAYNVALASLPNFSLPGDLSPSARYWARDIVTPEWTMDDDGMVRVPTAPGLGVAVDTDRIESLAVQKHVLSAASTMVVVA